MRILRRTWRIIVTILIIYAILMIFRYRDDLFNGFSYSVRRILNGLKDAINNLIPSKFKDLIPINI